MTTYRPEILVLGEARQLHLPFPRLFKPARKCRNGILTLATSGAVKAAWAFVGKANPADPRYMKLFVRVKQCLLP